MAAIAASSSLPTMAPVGGVASYGQVGNGQNGNGQNGAGAMEDVLFATLLQENMLLNEHLGNQMDTLSNTDEVINPHSQIEADKAADLGAPDLIAQAWLPVQGAGPPKMADLASATLSGQDKSKTDEAEPVLQDMPLPQPVQDETKAAMPQTPTATPIPPEQQTGSQRLADIANAQAAMVAAQMQGQNVETASEDISTAQSSTDQSKIIQNAAQIFQAGEQRSDAHMAMVAAQATSANKSIAAPDKTAVPAQTNISTADMALPPDAGAEPETMSAKAELMAQAGVKQDAAKAGAGTGAEAAQSSSKHKAEPVEQAAPQTQISQSQTSQSQTSQPQTIATIAGQGSAAAMGHAAQPGLPVHVAGQPLAQSTLVHLAPHMAQPDSTAMAVQIIAKASDGESSFDIRLDPPELGRVDVKLLIDEAGRAHSHLTVEKVQTLDLMLRDREGLERALKDAGLDLAQDGLNFSLKSQDQQDHTADLFRNRARNLRMENDIAAPEAAAVQQYRAETGRLDIRV